MTKKVVEAATDFALPSSIVTKIDLSHVVTELENVDNTMTTTAVRAEKGGPAVASPVLSQQLTDFLKQNELTLDDGQDRSDLIKKMRKLKDAVPIIHMTFAVSADPESLQQLVHWLRTEVDARAVIEVGLQPSLIAGVYVRTPNHVHDLSLRQMLRSSRGKLVEELGALRGK